eukprot:m.192665 g.192665  ORF g.192665 m.192665 type:complete len:96 (+) comp24953_c0_seq1:3380-3667(+)
MAVIEAGYHMGSGFDSASSTYGAKHASPTAHVCVDIAVPGTDRCALGRVVGQVAVCRCRSLSVSHPTTESTVPCQSQPHSHTSNCAWVSDFRRHR